MSAGVREREKERLWILTPMHMFFWFSTPMFERVLIKYATTLLVIKLQFSVKINKIKHEAMASFLRIVYGVVVKMWICNSNVYIMLLVN